jgi:hypothetical protein
MTDIEFIKGKGSDRHQAMPARPSVDVLLETKYSVRKRRRYKTLASNLRPATVFVNYLYTC